MKVFITGGSGYVGSVLVERLIAAGYEVSALARSEASAARLAATGARPVRGQLADAALLRTSAESADAVIHAAVDYSMSDEANATELAAVTALVHGAGAADASKPVVYTSTGLVYGFDPARSTDEDAELPEVSAQPVKAAAERLVLNAPGITPIIVRAGLVYGRGGSGLITGLIGSAEQHDVATYIDDGANTWHPIHVDDLAALYLAALAAPVAGVYNAVGDHPFSFRELAEAIADLTGAQALSIPFEAAQHQLGPFAHVLASTSRTSADKARRTFAWAPAAVPLIDDVRAGSYRSAVRGVQASAGA
ncbi:NAD-dependent epimerase/dehydratase family protein [Gryllotalpicola daejeonensis]|uniref:NAD-dependent epimerase/dehydratase family protein n=1 Tax=Gryllotalpicola daejeonensis TaxID=993087 RepID=A0ABP7ZJ78_9MICO